MSDEKPPKRSAGEQFSDPLSWTPDTRMPGPPSSRPILHDSDRREKDIHNKILEEYGGTAFDTFKPIIAMMLIAVLVLSQIDRSNKTQAIAYTVVAMIVGGSIYTMIANDTMPPLLSMLFKGAFMICVMGVIFYVLAVHTDMFSPPKDKEEQRRYNVIQDNPHN